MKPVKVLIIGAGPSGMISALCLAKLGISCTIVERNAAINNHPKAHELNSRSIEILSELGFSMEELAQEASPTCDGARILFCNTINEEFGRIDLEAEETIQGKYEQHLQAPRPYLNISQTALEKIILKKVKAHPLISIHFNHQWQSLAEKEAWVESEILNRTEKCTFKIKSQFVIAADGAGSRCRGFLGIPMKGPDKIQDFASAYFETNLRSFIKTPAKLYWILNPFAPGIFIAHHIDKRWVYMLPVYLNYQQKEQFNTSFFEQTIKTALGNPKLDITIKSISFWRMSAQLAERYRKGRVLLVGDAAHRFPPTGGLGMNTGIADAHNICWKLAVVLNENAALDFLDTYETERRPIAEQNTAESVHNYHKILEVAEAFGLGRAGLEMLAKFQGAAPTKWLPKSLKRKVTHWASSLAANKLKKYDKSPELQKKVLDTISEQTPHFDRIGLDIGYIYENGALIADGTSPQRPANRVTEYIPSTHPGARFPHFDLSESSNYTSTHDFIQYQQFALLIREKGQAWENAYHQFIQHSPVKVELIPLHQLGLPSSTFQDLVNLCEIEANGAILIRPDGHVAFRSKSHPSTAIALSDLFEQVFCKSLKGQDKIKL